MNRLKKYILNIIITTVWISISEFIRNEFLIKNYWINHFNKIGVEFPSAPLNGIIWVIWSLGLSICIYVIATKFTIVQTIFITWFSSFFMMWIVLYNLGVLPQRILFFAVPLSIVEVLVATLMVKRMIRYDKSIFLKKYIMK
ncbi:hypothetical protein OX284_013600 [Flavobacterium sp. SUN046]|uniref:hypothetical protein n=1 Tax=Flavobacterium sp. SUN046 TaxID=3002440 RepID=UPI002DBA0BDB|nr:hypothetical protein [Flavobacterium sp. SUN046]MEC4050472.1 hypothetical protein [Flavobacterium sp. SUN046]